MMDGDWICGASNTEHKRSQKALLSNFDLDNAGVTRQLKPGLLVPKSDIDNQNSHV